MKDFSQVPLLKMVHGNGQGDQQVNTLVTYHRAAWNGNICEG